MDLGNLRSPVKPCEYCVCDVTPPGVVPFRVRRGARIRHASAIYMIVVDKHIGSREKRKRSRRACPSIITSTLLNAPPPVAGPRGAPRGVGCGVGGLRVGRLGSDAPRCREHFTLNLQERALSL